MRQLPISFVDEMVRAIEREKDPKTQTRRVIKWPAWVKDIDAATDYLQRRPALGLFKDGKAAKAFKCPYGRAGDLLYVREAHTLDIRVNQQQKPSFVRVGYPGNKHLHYYWDKISLETQSRILKSKTVGSDTLRPPMFLFKEFCRIWLKVLSVRVERIQDISEADARAEGFKSKADLIILWDQINAKRGYSWESNPWVWAIEFERTER